MVAQLLEACKKNLILEGNDDDTYLKGLISAAIAYAEGYQHLPDNYYTTVPEGQATPNEMSPATVQGIVMLVTHWYESRDGGTGGFFADNTSAADKSMDAVHTLLRMGRDWRL